MSRRFMIRLTQEELAVLAKAIPADLSPREGSRFARIKERAEATLTRVRLQKGKSL